jgi:hypothetical protein
MCGDKGKSFWLVVRSRLGASTLDSTRGLGPGAHHHTSSHGNLLVICAHSEPTPLSHIFMVKDLQIFRYILVPRREPKQPSLVDHTADRQSIP